MDYSRHAIFYAPPEGSALARFGAEWLGWDAAAGCEATPPDPPASWDAATRVPRKYGFHGTIKPPFRLAEGTDAATLRADLRAFAAARASVTCAPLALSRIGGFHALVPSGPCAALSGLAAEVVTGFDRFRAPPTEAELARRRRCRLTDRQEALLDRYGYPYVLEEFRFHLTLTGATQAGAASRIEAALRARMTDLTAAPFVVSELCLFGEGREDGRFRIIERFAMPGARKDRAVETGSIRKGIRTCEG